MERIEPGLPGHVSPGVRRPVQRLSTRLVANRYGVSTRSVERWTKDVAGFPRPLVINKRKYWSEADLDDFDASRSRA